MSTVYIAAVNPIALDAVVTAVGALYTVVTKYNQPPVVSVVDLEDSFTTLPATLTVNLTSTTVPSGYHLAVTGAGTWTTLGSSALTGAFTVPSASSTSFTFTVVVTNGATTLASHDPKITVRRTGTR